MNLDRLRSIQVSAFAKEAAFGTPEAVDCLIRMNAGMVPRNAVDTINDGDLIGGTEEPSEAEVYARYLEFAFGQNRVKPNTLAWALAYALGSCTTTTPSGATNARKHICTPLQDETAMPTFTLEAKMTAATQKKYSGCFIDSLTLNLQRGANRFANLTGTIIGSGIVASGTADEAEVSEGGLNAADAAIWLDTGSYDGTSTNDLNLTTSDIVGNPTEDSPQAVDLQWGFNNNVDRDFLFELGSGLYMGGARRSARTQTLRYTRLYEDSTYEDAVLAQTEFCMQVRIKNAIIEAGFYHGLQLTFPLLQIANRTPGERNGKLIETLDFHVLEHGTYGSVIAEVFNTQTAYAA